MTNISPEQKGKYEDWLKESGSRPETELSEAERDALRLEMEAGMAAEESKPEWDRTYNQSSIHHPKKELGLEDDPKTGKQ